MKFTNCSTRGTVSFSWSERSVSWL